MLNRSLFHYTQTNINMNATKIIIPFDFPFAILEHRYNPDSSRKPVYAVADGQYTYGPLSLFQYHNDIKYSNNRNEDEEILERLPCREFYIVEPGSSIDDAIEIIDERRGRIYVKEIIQEIRMKELIQEISECRKEIRSLKSIVLSDDRRRSISTKGLNSSPILQRNASITIKRNINTAPRSHSARINRVLFTNVKSSGYGQQTPSYATPKRLLRK